MELTEIEQTLKNYIGTLSLTEEGLVFTNRNALTYMKNVPVNGDEYTATKYEMKPTTSKVLCRVRIEKSGYKKSWLDFSIDEKTCEIRGGHSFNFDPKDKNDLTLEYLESQLAQWGFKKKHGCEQLSLF